MLVLNLVPEGVSVKACSDRQRVLFCGQGIHMQIILILISDEVLQAAYFGFGTDYAGSWFR